MKGGESFERPTAFSPPACADIASDFDIDVS
jgi:hypothetical protein